MSQPNSKFPTMGTSAASGAKNASAEGVSSKLIKRKNTQAANPAIQDSGNRAHVKASGARAYGITTTMPAYRDPQIAPVQSNGRLFSSAIDRTKPNFQAGYTSLN